MNRSCSAWLGALWLLSSQFAAAADSSLASPWLRLMHYGASGEKSAMESRAFFFSPEGQRAPDLELAAQLVRFKQSSPLGSDAASDPICAFPARARFLREHVDPSLPSHPCPDLDAWKRKLQFRSLSMVYSSAYAGNSASMFGHNLIKINLEHPVALGEGAAELLDYGVGFLAQTDPTDTFTYAMKGLFGGYPGTFTLQPYYELVNTYAYAENRDLWELEIPLSAVERELFLEHLWELLQHASTPYYFTHVNCSSMLLRLLDVVKPEWNLTRDLHGFILPGLVMRRIAEHLPPAAGVQFRPSQRRLFKAQFDALTERQQEQYAQLKKGRLAASELADAPLLDAALAGLTLDKSNLAHSEQASIRALESQILLARAGLPIGPERPLTKAANNNPMYAHAPQKVEVGLRGSTDARALALRWRYGWHDLLDPLAGFDPYYQLNYLDVQASVDQKAEQRTIKATIAEVWSLSPYTASDPIKSWILAGGTESVQKAGRTASLSTFEAAAGWAFEGAVDRSLIALLPDLTLGVRHDPRPSFYSLAALRGLWLQRWSDRWQSLLTLKPGWSQSGLREDLYSFELRWNLSRAQQLGISLTQSERRSLQLGFSQFL